MTQSTYYNRSHRIYGKARWPLLTAGWEVLDYFDKTAYGPNYIETEDGGQGNSQPVHVLRLMTETQN